MCQAGSPVVIVQSVCAAIVVIIIIYYCEIRIELIRIAACGWDLREQCFVEWCGGATKSVWGWRL